jgi:acyl carrier protein
MEALTTELKVKIVDLLNLQHIKPEEIGDDDLLFSGKIELDSIDALELIVLLEKDYGLKIASKEEGIKIFQSVRSIAEYITKAKG